MGHLFKCRGCVLRASTNVPILTLDGANAKFSNNGDETYYSAVQTFLAPHAHEIDMPLIQIFSSLKEKGPLNLCK
jgi:hypothetical protein